jgi:hypothetical protein
VRQQGSPTPSDSIPHPATAPISIVVRPVLTYGACAHTLGSSESVAVGGDGVGSMNIRVGDRSGEVAISMCVASATERDRSPAPRAWRPVATRPAYEVRLRTCAQSPRPRAAADGTPWPAGRVLVQYRTTLGIRIYRCNICPSAQVEESFTMIAPAGRPRRGRRDHESAGD